jgi:hypothetical protein
MKVMREKVMMTQGWKEIDAELDLEEDEEQENTYDGEGGN